MTEPNVLRDKGLGALPSHVSLVQDPAEGLEVDAVAVAVAAGEPLAEGARSLDEALGGLLSELLRSGEHRGRLHEVLLVPTGGRAAAPRVLLYGLGPARDLDGQRLRFAHHEMMRAARRYGYRRLAVLCASPLRPEDLSGVIEGCVMGTWERRARQTGNHSTRIETLLLAGFGEQLKDEVALARQLGEATVRAREWQNAPPNELWPDTLADAACEMGTRHGLEVEVLGPEEMEAEGYRLLLGVGKGSGRPPRLIRAQYRGSRPGAGVNLALIGKGITFDSGGLTIKTGEQMVRMRGDMAGAAAVLAALEVIAASRLPVDVMAVVPAAENMLSGASQKPGDIWTSANGKTVEVVNTDAEGRLVLADALTFAIRRGATHIVDLATLTAAARVAIGHAASAAVSNDDVLWQLVARAGELAGDRVWRLPIYPDYRELLNSGSADLRNAYYGEAGVITAGMFIGEFAEDRPWVHIDIAGSAWNENADLTSVPRGPLGAGTRLCVRLAQLMAAER